MKFTLGQLKQAEVCLGKIANSSMSVQMGYRFLKLLKTVDIEMKSLEEQRTKLVHKYGEEKDGSFQVKKENMKNFMDDMKELMSIEVEVPFDPVPLSTFENIQMTPVEIASIEPFIQP